MRGNFPSTRAVHFLKQRGVEFAGHIYRYTGVGGVAKEAAAALGLSEADVFKTLVFQTTHEPLLVVVDAGHRVSMHKLSNAVGKREKVVECSARDAERYTGYRVGGISPFGTRRV